MASSSVSQESLDRDDDGGLYANSADFYARRSRIRLMRAKGTLYKTDREVTDGAVQENDTTGQEVSPSHSAANRIKEKRCRPNHFHGKGKLAKDKRKLREKRRSTGVVHLPSTESTGDSLDEDDEECKMRDPHVNVDENATKPAGDLKQTVKKLAMNTSYNSSSSTCTTSKSPSDVDADLEDNQDEGRVQSDYPDIPSSNKTAGLRKQPSIESTMNGLRDATIKPEPVSVTRDRDTRTVGSRIQSLAANFSKSNKDSPTPYSPIGYSGIRRNIDSPRWSPKTAPSAADRVGASNVGREGDVTATSKVTTEPRENLERKSVVTPNGEYRVTTKLSPFPPTNYGRVPMSQTGPKMAESKVTDHNVNQDANHDMKKLNEENRRLLRLLEERDNKISQLERRISELEKESSGFADVKADLEEQNATLLRAIIKLTAQ